MTKAYWIARTTEEGSIGFPEFLEASSKPVMSFGGRFLVRGEQGIPMDGDLPPTPVAIVEFENYETALACHESSEYREAVAQCKTISDITVFVEMGAY